MFRFAKSAIAVLGSAALLVTVASTTKGPIAREIVTSKPAAQDITVAFQRPEFVPRHYTVRRGNTLSGIAKQEYGNARDWPGIGKASDIRDPNLIEVGQRLTIPNSPSSVPYSAPHAVAVTVSDTSHHRTKQSPPPSAAPVVSSSFQACVIRAESGGNAQIWNASGHYGLYQFSDSTWVAAGGEAALFGHASAAYQTEVFWKAYDLWGTSPWAPYDGC
jgi:LysM repeat protein